MTPSPDQHGPDAAQRLTSTDHRRRPSQRFFPDLREQAGPDRAVPRARLRRGDVLIALAFAVAVFCGDYALERALDRRKVLDQYDVMFNVDPNTRLAAISHGQGHEFDSVIHPGLKVYFSQPIKLIAKAARSTGLVSKGKITERAFRRALGLLVVPAVSGLGIAVAYTLFVSMGLGRTSSMLMTLLCSLSFSQLVFGSLPDHFAMTGCLLGVLLLLAVDLVHREGKVRWAGWLGAGCLVTGVTVTNLASVLIVFATAQWCAGVPWRRLVRNTSLVAVAAVACAGVLVMASRAIERGKQATFDQAVNQHAANYIKEQRDYAGLPRAFLDPIAPTGLISTEMAPIIRQSNFFMTGLHDKMFGLNARSRPWMVVLACGLAALGGWSILRRDTPLRAVGAASCGVLAFNLTLHTFWGNEFFVYSQHWLVPLAVLFAGNLTWPGRVGRSFAGVYTVLLVAVAVNNAGLLQEIFAMLHSWQRGA